MKIANIVLVASLAISLLTIDSFAQNKTKNKKTSKKTTSVQKKETPKVDTKKPAVPNQKENSKTTNTKSPSALPQLDASQGEKKVRDIVAVLEYMLNILASSSTPSRDKDVLVTESYSKIFRDTKVQIEDDLDDKRTVITNKDVVPYLKDVDFFFTDARFEFTIDNIQEGNTGTSTFYKVTTKRNLKGTTSEGEAINKTMPRYIEINYDPTAQDLKIVSIYTNEFDEKRALTNWWNELSYEWKSFFTKTSKLQDSVSLNDIKKITSLESIDLSNNIYIQTIEPLAQLSNLKILNLSKTKIKDLTPLRNLTTLTELYLSYTPVKDISALKYSGGIKKLAIDHTEAYDISVLQKMPLLQYLDVSHIDADDFSPVSNLSELTEVNFKNTKFLDLISIKASIHLKALNISGTPVRDLTAVGGLKDLVTLGIDSTHISSLAALSTSANLNILHANYTLVADLKPLANLSYLEKIYCDKSGVTKDMADAFMAAHPTVLVIYNSEDLKTWWSLLTPGWQKIFEKTAKLSTQDQTPTKEVLASITNIDEINLSGNTSITSLEPLRKLHKLRILNVEKTLINDVSPLQDNKEITYLNINETEVRDLSPIGALPKLVEFHADKSKIESIEPLAGSQNLKKLYVDQTAIHDITALEFLEKNPNCLLIYKTIHLNRWWMNLSPAWKDVFHNQLEKDTTASRENLHRLTEQKILSFKNSAVRDLSALSEFVCLKELHFSETAIKEIPALENIKSLTSLHATNSPLDKIDALGKLTMLEDLDISNTPVYDLKVIGTLKTLKNLNCAGTQIKKLNSLEELKSLENFDCSNTNVSNLDPIAYIPLKVLKCYNTKITKREIENFKKINKACDVIYYR